jgi:xanthine/CO dehydrogenase XdhC/CoxF family maturation factor
MKELREILSEVERLTSGERAVLATVVEVKGSSYRVPE